MAGRARRGALPAAALLAVALVWPALTSPSARAASAVPLAGATSVAPASNLRVIPFPGTPDAAPDSQIIFSALRPADLTSVTVRGSSSGAHTGHITALPDNAGTAFAPDHPFAAGELVTVSAALASPTAATASGAPGDRSLEFSFRIEVPATDAPSTPTASVARATPASADHTSGRTQSFHSQDNFHPTAVNATSDPDTSSGDIFLNPNNAPQVGSMILNSKGQLVWFRRVTKSATFNLEVQHYQGNPVLTWWHGNIFEGHGINGQDVIMNRNYQIVRVLHGGNGYSTDLHEFQLTPQGTAWVDDYVPVHANLSSVGGPSNGTVVDCVIQELSIKTGQVLWEWHALGHIPLNDSHQTPNSSRPFDFFHCNSIQQEPNNNILISARNTWAVYLIGEQRGHVIWELGGKHSNFKIGQGANFEWQHDARQVGETISLFDDGGVPQVESQSSGKLIAINKSSMTASLQHSFDHSPPLLAGAMGSYQDLPNQNVFVGWGTQPDFSEYNSSGQQIFNGSFPTGTTSYRAYRFNWSGVPMTPPALANEPQANGDVDVWASWNGATNVNAWRVLGGPSGGSLRAFASGKSTGFETRLLIQSEPRYVAVQALDSSGHVIHTSHAHAVRPHVSIFGPTAFAGAGGGATSLPVGCFTGNQCHVSAEVHWGSKTVAQSSAQTVQSRTGTLLHFSVNSTMINALKRAKGHRSRVFVSIHDSSGHGASKHMELILYRSNGSGPTRKASNSPTIQIARTTGFVSSGGAGQLLVACYGPVPCHPQATISAGGSVIATTKSEHVGAEELASIYFKLTSAGEQKLRHASGNQLAAQVKLSNDQNTATGQIALVGYS